MPEIALCPGPEQLRELLAGRLPDDTAARLEKHLLGCASCVRQARRFREEDPLAADLRQPPAAAEAFEPDRVAGLLSRLRGLRPGPAAAPAAGAGDTASPHQTAPPTTGNAAESYTFLAPPGAADEIGRLGPYRVLGVLGAGGMGVVFRAEDARLQRPVALKVLKPDQAEEPSARQRFLREARAAAALTHDHVITIFQVGEDRGVPFLAMQLLEGESLQDRLGREGSLSVAEAVRIGREVAEGLAAAHARGLIHRDIKPANVWLEGARGRVKILDFGLVRSTRAETALTREGAIVGTPAYMAPEQALGEAITPACDLFSLGCLLYRLCTGQVPVPGADTISTLVAVTTQEPADPRQLNPDLPEPLCRLVLRLLAKRSQDRPESARAVAAELAALAAPAGPAPPRGPATPVRQQKAVSPARRTPARRGPGERRRWLVGAGAVLLLGTLGAVGYLLGPVAYRITTDNGQLVITADDPDVEVRVKGNGDVRILDLRDRQEVTLRAGSYEIELTRNPQGLKLSTDRFVLTRGGRQVVSVTRQAAEAAPPADGTGELVLESEDPNVQVILQPRGRRGRQAVHLGTERRIRLLPGEYEVQLANVRRNLRLSTDHFTLAPGARVVVRVSRGPADPEEPVAGNQPPGEVRRFDGHEWPVFGVAFTPDGRRAFSAGDPVARLWEVSTAQELRRFPGHADAIKGVALSPDGRQALTAGHDSTVRLWDVSTGQELAKLTGHVAEVWGVAFSPTEDVALSCSQDRTLRLWDLTSRQCLHVFRGPHTDCVQAVAFSPDGTLAVSAGFDRTLQVWDVVNRKYLRRLEGHAGPVQAVAFCPDGRHVLSGSRDHTLRLWDVNTGAEVRRFAGHRHDVWGVALTPDGGRAVSVSADGTVRLWDVETGEELHCFTGHTNAVLGVAVSPDGRLAASAGADKTVRLWRLPAGPGAPVLDGGKQPKRRN
jgi:WD40 repeat protein